MKILIKTLSAFLLILFVSACSKDSITNLSDQIGLSINNGATTLYKPTAGDKGDRNNIVGLSFRRTTFSKLGESASDYNEITFDLDDRNIFSQSMPYEVKNVVGSFVINKPQPLGFYLFSYVFKTKGHLNVIINHAKQPNLDGTYEGVIYKDNNTDSISVKGSFNVVLPPFESVP